MSQDDTQSDLQSFLQDLEAALHSTTQRAAKWRAWCSLCQVGSYGENVLPYTELALSELEAAYQLDEQDGQVLHHLAVAYHAQAWDLELQEDFPAADRAWLQALFYWKSLQARSSFWQELIEKGKSLKGFDQQSIENFRQNLLTYLIEIHVDFVHYYYEQNQSSHAARHIELIQRARIPPAVRKQLELLVYQTLSAFIPNLLAESRYIDILNRLDDCLQFTPTYPPALTTYLETAQEWIEQLPPTCDWQVLEQIDRWVLPRWQTLQTIDPSAAHLLSDLAASLGMFFLRRAQSLLHQKFESGIQNFQFPDSEEDFSYQRAIAWLERAAASDPEPAQNLYTLWMCQAQFALFTGLSEFTLSDASQVYEQGIQYCQKAMGLALDKDDPRKLEAQILYLRARSAIQNFRQPAKNYEADLTKALQLDPENHELKQFVKTFSHHCSVP